VAQETTPSPREPFDDGLGETLVSTDT